MTTVTDMRDMRWDRMGLRVPSCDTALSYMR